MVIIGVTGGVGTGKSTVSRMFGRLGAVVLDADRIAHQLMEPGTAVYRKIRRLFGSQVIRADGRMDRKRLGEIVFRDPSRLKQLTAVIHPAVRRQIQARIRRLRQQKESTVVVLDIPLLVESGSAYRTDVLVVVSAPGAVANRRLRLRSGWSSKEVQRRGRFQTPLPEKERQADFVVNNSRALSVTRRQVRSIWKQIVKEKKFHGGRKDG